MPSNGFSGRAQRLTPPGRPLSNNTARYDPCQRFFWLSGEDNDPDHQSLGSMLYGTGKSKGFWTLKELELQSYPEEGTAPQRWVDWDPRPT